MRASLKAVFAPTMLMLVAAAPVNGGKHIFIGKLAKAS
jgi:hypothetical protein